MRRRQGAISRTEVSDTLEQHRDDAQEKTDQIEETVYDTETERQVLEGLELSGTAEGGEQVEMDIEQAQDASLSEFEAESGELEQIHAETQEFQEDMHERSDASSADVERVADGVNQLNRDSAKSQLERAKDSIQEDIDFLDDYERRGQEAREESERINEEQRSRIESARGS